MFEKISNRTEKRLKFRENYENWYKNLKIISLWKKIIIWDWLKSFLNQQKLWNFGT